MNYSFGDWPTTECQAQKISSEKIELSDLEDSLPVFEKEIVATIKRIHDKEVPYATEVRVAAPRVARLKATVEKKLLRGGLLVSRSGLPLQRAGKYHRLYKICDRVDRRKRRLWIGGQMSYTVRK